MRSLEEIIRSNNEAARLASRQAGRLKELEAAALRVVQAQLRDELSDAVAELRRVLIGGAK